jgi:hypothetical protein
VYVAAPESLYLLDDSDGLLSTFTADDIWLHAEYIEPVTDLDIIKDLTERFNIGVARWTAYLNKTVHGLQTKIDEHQLTINTLKHLSTPRSSDD